MAKGKRWSIFGRNPDIRVIPAWAIQRARDSQNQTIAALEQRILELESANAIEREKIRDEALVEAARVVDAMICPIPSGYRGMKVSSDLNSRAVCDKILSLRRPR